MAEQYEKIVDDYYENHGGYTTYFSKKENKNIHTCNVCRKEYKNLKPLQKHLDRKDCYDVEAVFYNTILYRKAINHFKTIKAKTALAGNSSRCFRYLNQQRKKELIRAVTLFEKNIVRIGHYLFWADLRAKNFFSSPEHAISVLTKESTVRQYQQYLITNQAAIQLTDKFTSKVHDRLLNNDYDAIIKYLERGMLSINNFEEMVCWWAAEHDYDLAERDAIDYFLECLSPVQEHRLKTIINTICYLNEF